jgi:hypothetical protein
MVERLELSPEELVAAGIQSPHWELYNNYQFREGASIDDGRGEPMPAIKFGEDKKQQRYDLINRNGQRFVGIPRPQTEALKSNLDDEWTIELTVANEELYSNCSAFAILAWHEHQD